MNRCLTCKHWGREKDAGRMFRVCLAIPLDGGQRTCERSDDLAAKNLPEDHAETLAFREAHKAVTYDDSAYRTTFRTRADFGCTLHEPKEHPV